MSAPRLVCGVLIALALLVTITPPVGADYDPLASGATRLRLNREFLSLLKHSGVELSAIAPAKLKGATASFPVVGGKLDPTDGRGTVEHEGGLRFRAGARSIPLSALQLKTTQRHSPFSAKLGGSQLKLAAAGALAFARDGFGGRVTASSLALSAKVATRLDKKLRRRGVFEAGLPLGSAVTRVQPGTIAVLGRGSAELTLAPGISAKLASLFVAVNPIFPAEHMGPLFTLPIFGGTIAPDASEGTLQTSGAIELLQLGGGQVFWHQPGIELANRALSAEVDVQPSPPYRGNVGRAELAELSLIGAKVSSDPRRRTVTVSGASSALSVSAAADFNQAFAEGKPVFVAGEPLGSVSFPAQGQ